MRNNIYKELFELVQSTGEKLVVINPETDEALVIMPMVDYRALKGVAPKINNSLFSLVQTTNLNEVSSKKVDLSFWAETANPSEREASIDRNPNSVRIDTVQSKQKKSVHKVAEVEAEDSAGEGYYFEPTDEEIDYQ